VPASRLLCQSAASLGPIAPQYGGLPAVEVIEEFKRAKKEIKKDPSSVYIWQSIIGKYNPTMIGECENAIKWAEDIIRTWLEEHIFAGMADYPERAKNVVRQLSDRGHTRTYVRHLNIDGCKDIGLNVVSMASEEFGGECQGKTRETRRNWGQPNSQLFFFSIPIRLSISNSLHRVYRPSAR